MHEDAVATITKEERHRLVLSIALRTLWVSDEQMYLLPHLIQFRERFSTTKNMLPWSLGENGIDASAIVRTTFDKREWKQLDLGGVIINDMARLSQYFSVFILHNNSPRKLLNFNDTILAFINYSFN